MAKHQNISTHLTALVARKLLCTGYTRVLTALSGGADSVALLRLLKSASETECPQLRLKAVHCNFSLRGPESDRDERFCRSLCSQLDIPLEVVRFDANRAAQERKVSVEVACRDLRYSFFRSLMLDEGWECTAVAHHADDNAETLLLNLMRGSGLKGLKAMREQSDGIWRPLLETTHDQLLSTLEELGQPHVEDSTNAHSDYSRNFLRNEVFPLLETRWPHARQAVANSARLLAADHCLAMQALCIPGVREPLPLDKVLQSVSPESYIFHYISQAGGTPGIAEEIASAMAKDDRTSGKIWYLPSGARVSLERGCIEILENDPMPLSAINAEEIALSPEIWKEIESLRDPATAWLPKSPEAYEIRRAREGDRIEKGGRGGSALVSKLFKDAKLSRRQKEQTPVVADRDSGFIVWIPGIRRGAAGRVPADAERAWRFRKINNEK